MQAFFVAVQQKSDRRLRGLWRRVLGRPAKTAKVRLFRKGLPVLYAALKLVHILSIIVWVGGMVFAHFFLRPDVAALEPPVRLRLMHDVLQRFFGAVLVTALAALFSGSWMIGRAAKEVVQSGGQFHMPLAWMVMAGLGTVMVLIFGHIRFALFKRMQRAVAASDWPAAGAAMNTIRQWVGVNLLLGLFIIVFTLLV
jgi:uncharacterized membrane protein